MNFCRTHCYVLIMLALVFLSPFARSAMVIETSNLGIRLSSGTVVTDATVALGYFTGGFTPELSNFNSWAANFLGVTAGSPPTTLPGGNVGYYVQGFSPDLSVSFVTGVNGSGEQYASVNPVGARLYLIGVNNPSSSGSISGATQTFILTDPTWTIPTFTISTVTPDTILAITANTTAPIGSISTSGSDFTATMVVIPEPSSMSLVIMGLASALAFRRKRASLIGGN